MRKVPQHFYTLGPLIMNTWSVNGAPQALNSRSVVLQVQPEFCPDLSTTHGQELACMAPSSISLPQDFSDILEDDWSDFHIDAEWLSPADEADGNMDLWDVFEDPEDTSLDAALVQHYASGDVRSYT